MYEKLTLKARFGIFIALIFLAQAIIFFSFNHIFNVVLRIEEAPHEASAAIEELLVLKANVIVLFLISSVLIIGAVVWLTLEISARLRNVVEIFRNLSAGDAVVQINNSFGSEPRELCESVKALSAGNQKIVEVLTSLSKGDFTAEVKVRSEKDVLGFALNNMLTNFKHLIREVQNQISSLITSSQTIYNTVAQVAVHSKKTVSSVTETTASVEELKQTAHLANERAQEVTTCTEETLQIVKTNEKLLQATIDEMKQISKKMSTISESIVKLSAHGKAIGNIIDTVNELSEQSNLLAVNAAIEASKAGEHGKNFTVVAQEMRLLAEQSKSATIQVRSILNEIQSSTTTAVLATEQGAKAVEKGVAQSAETSKSMQMLSVSVSRMTEAANQISIASHQQFIGIEQMTMAMSQISKATSYLVEQMQQIEEAVTCLNSIGTSFKKITDRYVLAQEEKNEL